MEMNSPKSFRTASKITNFEQLNKQAYFKFIVVTVVSVIIIK